MINLLETSNTLCKQKKKHLTLLLKKKNEKNLKLKTTRCIKPKKKILQDVFSLNHIR